MDKCRFKGIHPEDIIDETNGCIVEFENPITLKESFISTPKSDKNLCKTTYGYGIMTYDYDFSSSYLKMTGTLYNEQKINCL